jgi:hypothetical protein
MASKYRLNELQNCLDSIETVSNTFGRMAKMLEESDEVQDKGVCIEATDRITVELNDLKKMLQEDIMLEELS